MRLPQSGSIAFQQTLRVVSPFRLLSPLPRPVLYTRFTAMGAAASEARSSKDTIIETQEAEENKAEESTSGHAVPSTNVVSEEAQDPEIKAFQDHQATAARLSLAEEARTLADIGTWGLISTLGTGDAAGYPAGSIVEYAVDQSGRLLFAFSSMSSHTRDVRKHGKASLTIPSPGFKGLQDARVSLTGDIAQVPKEEDSSVREMYKQKHPNSFWIDFGDFSIFRMTPVTGRLIGGFARAGQISAEEYSTAAPDPVFKFSAPMAGHMNDDHSSATIAIVKHCAGITVSKADILTIDRLGMSVMCGRNGETFKARIPFPRTANSRKEVKDVIIEMTRAAMSSGSS